MPGDDVGDALEVAGGSLNLNRSLGYVVLLALGSIGGATLPQFVLTTQGQADCETTLAGEVQKVEQYDKAAKRCRRVLRRKLGLTAREGAAPDMAEGAEEAGVDTGDYGADDVLSEPFP